MKLKELADAIYVISLPTRLDRRAALEANWAKHGLTTADFTYINGVVPGQHTILWNEMRCFEAEGNSQNLRNQYVVGAVGCKRAWRNTLGFFLDSPHETVLICEDDCRWDSDTAEVLAEVDHFPDGWEMLYLGGRHRIAPIPFNSSWVRLTGTRLTTAIIFNRASAQKLFDILNSYCPFEIDVYLDQSHNVIWNAYALKDMVATQRASESSISQIGK